MRDKLISVCRLVVVVGLLCILSSCVSTRVPPSLVGGNVGGSSPEYVMRQGLYHSVAPGETLWRISKMYDVDIAVIREINEISDVKDLDIGRQLYIPSAAKRKNVITLYPNRKWKYIVIHHSATDKGSSSRFNNAHLRRGWNGVGYHFIIDNGTCGKDDGQIETSPRWIKQIDGAHCKAGSMNIKAIGICLVGNFSEDTVSVQQMSSLVYLTNQLRNYYNIPESHIVGHGQVSGAKTECPGTRFPWKDFWTRIRKKEK